MLFDVAHLSTFFYIKGMDAIVTAIRTAAVVDAATGYDGHVCALTDKEIIIYHIL